MKNFLSSPTLLLALVLGLGSTPLSRGTVYQYDNLSSWFYGTSGIPRTPAFLTPFSDPKKFAIGEVFAPPAAGVFLETAGFWISRSTALSAIPLSIYFAEWDAAQSRVSGPIYTFEGVDYSWSPQPIYGLDDYTRVDFNTPHIALTEGQNYIMFMTSAPFTPDVAALTKFGYERDGTWLGHAWTLDGMGLGDASEKSWSPYSGDLIIQVQFNDFVPPMSPVPEPSTYGVAASGLLAALAFYRRNRGTKPVKAQLPV